MSVCLKAAWQVAKTAHRAAAHETRRQLDCGREASLMAAIDTCDAKQRAELSGVHK